MMQPLQICPAVSTWATCPRYLEHDGDLITKGSLARHFSLAHVTESFLHSLLPLAHYLNLVPVYPYVDLDRSSYALLLLVLVLG